MTKKLPLADGVVKCNGANERMRHVRKECGYDVRLLSAVYGTLKDEARLKKRFAACHAGHEWFRIEGELADHVRSEIWGMNMATHDSGRNKLIAAQNRRYARAIKKSRKALDATMQKRFAIS